MSECKDCVSTSKNTGQSKTAKRFGAPIKRFGMAMIATDGTENKIDTSVTIDQAVLDALLNHVDPSKRLYPIDVENATSTRTDPAFEEFRSGNKQKVSVGIRSEEVVVADTTSQYFGQLEALGGCNNIGFFDMDECENFRGNNKEAGYLKPRQVARNTYDALLQMASEAENGQNTIIKWDYAKTEKDADLAHIYGSSITADLEGATGLQDVTFENIVASAAADTIQFNAKVIEGDASTDFEDVPGLVIADITIIVNAITTTITDLTQQPDGSYIATVSDDLILAQAGSIAGSKDGLEFTTKTFVVVA